MTALLSPWLRAELYKAAQDAVLWKRSRVVAARAPKVKPDPESVSLTQSDLEIDDGNDRFDDDGSNIRVELTRPTSENSRVRMTDVVQVGRHFECQLSDGHHTVPGVVTMALAAKLEKDGRTLAQMHGALLSIRSFTLRLTPLGGRPEHISMELEQVKYYKGSSANGHFGSPEPLRDDPDFDSIFAQLGRYDRGELSEDPSDDEIIEARDDDELQSQGAASDASLSEIPFASQTTTQGNMVFATQIEDDPARRKLRELPALPEISIAGGVNLARPQASTSVAEGQRRKLLSLFQPRATLLPSEETSQVSQEKTTVSATPMERRKTSQATPQRTSHENIPPAKQQTPTKPTQKLIDSPSKKSTVSRAQIGSEPDDDLVSNPAGSGCIAEISELRSPPHRQGERSAKTTEVRSNGHTEAVRHDGNQKATSQDNSKPPREIDDGLPGALGPGESSDRPRSWENLVRHESQSPNADPAELHNEVQQPPPIAAVKGPVASQSLPAKSSASAPRAPHPLYIKYASRRMPKDQETLLQREESWLPSHPGRRFPEGNIPVAALASLATVKSAITPSKTGQNAASDVEIEVSGNEDDAMANVDTQLMSWPSSPVQPPLASSAQAFDESYSKPLDHRRGEYPPDSSDPQSQTQGFAPTKASSIPALSKVQEINELEDDFDSDENDEDDADDNLDLRTALPRALNSSQEVGQMNGALSVTVDHHPETASNATLPATSVPAKRPRSPEIEVQESPYRLSDRAPTQSTEEAVPATQPLLPTTPVHMTRPLPPKPHFDASRQSMPTTTLQQPRVHSSHAGSSSQDARFDLHSASDRQTSVRQAVPPKTPTSTSRISQSQAGSPLFSVHANRAASAPRSTQVHAQFTSHGRGAQPQALPSSALQPSTQRSPQTASAPQLKPNGSQSATTSQNTTAYPIEPRHNGSHSQHSLPSQQAVVTSSRATPAETRVSTAPAPALRGSPESSRPAARQSREATPPQKKRRAALAWGSQETATENPAVAHKKLKSETLRRLRRGSSDESAGLSSTTVDTSRPVQPRHTVSGANKVVVSAPRGSASGSERSRPGSRASSKQSNLSCEREADEAGKARNWRVLKRAASVENNTDTDAASDMKNAQGAPSTVMSRGPPRPAGKKSRDASIEEVDHQVTPRKTSTSKGYYLPFSDPELSDIVADDEEDAEDMLHSDGEIDDVDDNEDENILADDGPLLHDDLPAFGDNRSGEFARRYLSLATVRQDQQEVRRGGKINVLGWKIGL
ncbi:hypothetical protein CAC42_400 [Sphaceloma murrayae]|uniref:Telomere replication protein EST3 n=1 Tax=Sphaceloma murrayae TaxID=2082308 RepID=A0A2K1R3D5_9PEZI|nr:hypothetical protein CAC42_400 [Sphaceloma murrayae]